MIKDAVAAGSKEGGWSPLATVALWLAVHESGLDRPDFGFVGTGGFVEACLVVDIKSCGEGGHLVSVRLAYEETRNGA